MGTRRGGNKAVKVRPCRVIERRQQELDSGTVHRGVR
jgi:hypothetical protein